MLSQRIGSDLTRESQVLEQVRKELKPRSVTTNAHLKALLDRKGKPESRKLGGIDFDDVGPPGPRGIDFDDI